MVELIPVVIERAAELRARHGLKIPNALHAASAPEVRGDRLFLTNERQFAKVPGLTVRVPA